MYIVKVTIEFCGAGTIHKQPSTRPLVHNFCKSRPTKFGSRRKTAQLSIHSGRRGGSKKRRNESSVGRFRNHDVGNEALKICESYFFFSLRSELWCPLFETRLFFYV
jgi:hypothetical protein